MALVETAEGMGQSVMVDLSRASFQATVTVAEKGLAGSWTALRALRDAARQVNAKRATTGQVRLRTFARISRGEREIIDIGDSRTAAKITRELKRLGVTFAVDRVQDGRVFHVQGSDAKVVAHALDVASEQVDRRIARNRVKKQVAQQVDDAVARKKSDARSVERTRGPQTVQANRSEPRR